MKTIRTAALDVAAGFLVTVLLFFTTNGMTNPRPPLPQVPEISWPLYNETFDALYEIYPNGTTNAQITLGNFTYSESWSGWALNRSSASVTPFYVPGVDAVQTNIYSDHATFRFWFNPSFSSATQTNGTGPGAVAVLLELDAIGSNESANLWSLAISPSGNTLSLVAHSDDNPDLLLQTEISWQAGKPVLIALDYSTNGTSLFLNGQLVAQGAGTLSAPPQLVALFVGSTFLGHSVAWGDFDEFCVFGKPPMARWYHPLTDTDLLWYYTVYAANAAMGPISAEEIAAREARFAARRAEREETMNALSAFSLDDDGGMEAMAMRGTYGAVSDCVTNVPFYMTNMWAGFETNGTMTVTFDVVGTNGLIYDVLGTTNLASGPWFFVTNTPTCSTVVITNQVLTQTYYVLRSTQDSDGSGFPDWWQLQYFGTTGIDPYGDLDGDGWSNLQEYQNGTNPNQFNTPPAPRILSAVLDSGGTHVILTWQSGGGPVTAYGVRNSFDGEVSQVGNNTFTETIPTPLDFDGNIYDYLEGDWWPEPSFQVTAYFPNATHVNSAPVRISKTTLSLNVQVVRGTMSQPYIAVASPPAGLSKFRLFWITDDVGGFIYEWHDLPATNLVNGFMPIPTNAWQPYLDGAGMYLAAFSTNGSFGYTHTDPQAARESLYFPRAFNIGNDQRHLKENLKFLLRAATVSNTFSFVSSVPVDGFNWRARITRTTGMPARSIHRITSIMDSTCLAPL